MKQQYPGWAARISILLAVLGVLAVGGCESVVDLEVPTPGELLAVYGFFNPDSAWSVSVYRTAGLDERTTAEALRVKNARVMIMGDGRSDTLSSSKQVME